MVRSFAVILAYYWTYLLDIWIWFCSFVRSILENKNTMKDRKLHSPPARSQTKPFGHGTIFLFWVRLEQKAKLSIFPGQSLPAMVTKTTHKSDTYRTFCCSFQKPAMKHRTVCIVVSNVLIPEEISRHEKQCIRNNLFCKLKTKRTIKPYKEPTPTLRENLWLNSQ